MQDLRYDCSNICLIKHTHTHTEDPSIEHYQIKEDTVEFQVQNLHKEDMLFIRQVGTFFFGCCGLGVFEKDLSDFEPCWCKCF